MYIGLRYDVDEEAKEEEITVNIRINRIVKLRVPKASYQRNMKCGQRRKSEGS